MNVSISSVIISEEKIEQIKAAISQLDYHNLIFNTWGFSEVFEKGTAVSLIFHGIPGTGKTLMAQAVADSIGQSLRVIGTADIESSEPGGAERTIKKIFAIANTRIARTRGMSAAEIKKKFGTDIYDDPETRTHPFTQQEMPVPEWERLSGPPQLLCFDECDSMLVDRNAVGFIMSAQINTLLTELERFEGVIIFTTNRLGKLDPALERRIAAKVEFEFPDKGQRKAIWRRMIPMKAPIADDVDLDALSEFPLVGGNIKNAVLNAAREAAYKHLPKITKECFVKAVQKEVEGLYQFLASHEEEKYMRPVKSAMESLKESIDSVGGLKIERVQTTQTTVDIGKNQDIGMDFKNNDSTDKFEMTSTKKKSPKKSRVKKSSRKTRIIKGTKRIRKVKK